MLDAGSNVTYPISTFSGRRDNVPGRGTVTWAQLVATLSRPDVARCTLETCERSDCEHKSGLAWCPATWPPGHKRKVFGIEQVSLLVVDMDHMKPAELGGHLTRVSGYRQILHSSHSDRPNDRCLRLILVPSRPVRGDEWPRFWTGAIHMLGLPADTRCRDGSRLYFAPSRPSDASHPASDGTGYTFGYQEDGALLDVDAILAAAPPPNEIPDGGWEDYEVPEYTEVPEEKYTATVKVLAAAWPPPGSNRHGAHLALAGALARMGWPAEVIADFAYRVAHTALPGSGDHRKRLSAARSSVDKVQTGALVSGWPVLETILSEAGADGDAVIGEVTGLLGLQQAPCMSDEDRAEMDAVCGAVMKIVNAPASTSRKQIEAVDDDDMTVMLAALFMPSPLDVLKPFLTRSDV